MYPLLFVPRSFRASKSVRELFAHHTSSITVRLPSDEEYIRGYGRCEGVRRLKKDIKGFVKNKIKNKNKTRGFVKGLRQAPSLYAYQVHPSNKGYIRKPTREQV